MGINGIGSPYTQNYDVKGRGHSARGKSTVNDFLRMGNAAPPSESSDHGKRIGITTVCNRRYIAMYADSSAEQDMIVKRGEAYIPDTVVSRHTGYTDPDTKEKVSVAIKYVTSYSMDGISCREEKRIGDTEQSRRLWTIHFENEEDLGKVKNFLEGFDEEQRLTFASQRIFWKDFLDGSIDLADFKEFFASTNNGIIDFEKEIREGKTLREITSSTHAGYLNNQHFVGHVYTEESISKLFDRGSSDVKVSNFKEHETPNYQFIPEPNIGSGGMRILKNGQSVAVFSVDDLKIRVDEQTGTRVLISELGGYGGAWYDAIPVDAELENGLAEAIGVEEIREVGLEGYYIGTHAGTGIRYVMRPGDEGRGGKVLFRNAADVAKYNALAVEYYNRYPNLINSREEGRIWASFEIVGMAERTETGFVRIGFDNISYTDHFDYKKNWSAKLTGDTWELLWKWLEENRERMKEWGNFGSWRDIFDEIGGSYERVWSDEELKQGYLNH